MDWKRGEVAPETLLRVKFLLGWGWGLGAGSKVPFGLGLGAGGWVLLTE